MLTNIVLPVMLVYPVVTALLGMLMADHLKRERTKQKLLESEERYQNLARIAPVGIFRADESGATTYVNPMWCRISGLTEARAMGDGWLAAVHPEDRKILGQGWQETIRLERPSFADYRFLRPDGTIAWVMGQATPELNSQRQIVGYVGTITDISERKRAEELIRASLAEKEVLLKEVHHRVKNNLMTVIGLIKMQETKAPKRNIRMPLLRELEGRVRSMALVHESLHKSENLARDRPAELYRNADRPYPRPVRSGARYPFPGAGRRCGRGPGFRRPLRTDPERTDHQRLQARFSRQTNPGPGWGAARSPSP